ncbi:MAG: hypothetical protein U0Q07_16090 [Acidimicrobiales bacterium]
MAAVGVEQVGHGGVGQPGGGAQAVGGDGGVAGVQLAEAAGLGRVEDPPQRVDGGDLVHELDVGGADRVIGERSAHGVDQRRQR